MHPSLKSIREANELTLQYRNRQSTMLVDELIDDKLMQLLAFINRLKETTSGTAELRGRIKIFGECKRLDGENSGLFYGRLRYWLDRDTPKAKSLRLAPRRTEN
jgi:hypothetical protein